MQWLDAYVVSKEFQCTPPFVGHCAGEDPIQALDVPLLIVHCKWRHYGAVAAWPIKSAKLPWQATPEPLVVVDLAIDYSKNVLALDRLNRARIAGNRQPAEPERESHMIHDY
jgi:hypothetical protein